MRNDDPVHQKDGGWWFWDETWTLEYGPFPTEGAAEEHLRRYAHYYLSARGWRPAVGEFVRWTRDDLTQVICVVRRVSRVSGIIWWVEPEPIDANMTSEVDEATLDPISPLEMLALTAT